jgi:hypothetical protein
MRKSMRAGRAMLGGRAEGERTHTDFKSTSSLVVASTTAIATSKTAGING